CRVRGVAVEQLVNERVEPHPPPGRVDEHDHQPEELDHVLVDEDRIPLGVRRLRQPRERRGRPGREGPEDPPPPPRAAGAAPPPEQRPPRGPHPPPPPRPPLP